MNKINYALAMLTAAGASAATAQAQAATIVGSFTNNGFGYHETFTIDTVGVPEADAHYADFTLTNDNYGNTVAIAGDNTTGALSSLKGQSVDSYFGTGTASSTPFANQVYDSVKPGLYAAGSAPVLQPGVYVGDYDGYTLTLGVPEPDAWALLIAGAALTGGALRTSRRRRVSATA